MPQQASSFKLSDRDAFVSAVAKHYTILKCRAELDQLVQGLEMSYS